MRKYFFILAFLTAVFEIQAQVTFPYEVFIDSVQINGLPGLHSYAFAQHDGKWLLIGGRKDGLHPRQPFASFPASHNNTDVYVVDVATENVWSAPLSSLSTGIQEHLQSTNMNFHQDGDTLYIIGGYAFSATSNDHITFPKLSTIQVSGLINAVINNQSIAPFIKHVSDTRFAVTGGQLAKMGKTFYLVGGHQFDGRYNPMGHNTYVQTYTNEIRKFEIKNAGSTPVVSNYSTVADAIHLHRRDYNLLPQIFPDGSEGYTISSGVFQVNQDLPYLYPVDVKSTGITAHTTFNQYLSNYHCASAAIYDSVQNIMHNLFFGGISQYYYTNGNLEQDNQVPFVKTISRLSRAADGSLHEFAMSSAMPGLKGASAEFIPNDAIPRNASDVVKLSNIQGDSILLGYIVGGIESASLNPFSSNNLSQTNADPTIYKVYLLTSPFAYVKEIDGMHPYKAEVYPNPADGAVKIAYHTDELVQVEYHLTDINGRLLRSINLGDRRPGEHIEEISLPDSEGGYIMLNLIFDGKYFVSKRIVTSP